MKKIFLTLIAILTIGRPEIIEAYYNNNNADSNNRILKTAARELKHMAIAIGVSVITLAIVQSIFKTNDPIQNDAVQSETFDFHAPGTIQESFQSVAGAQQAKEELQYIVDFLLDPSAYTTIGAKMPCGILLAGAPGTGKTLLARALAGEANCAFISVNGSDFSSSTVGVGVARIKALFKQARKYPTTIIFIDEIDAVGSQRSQNIHSVDQDRNNTINQLLVEMDGFHKDTGTSTVIVIAATNYPHILDKALLRPGRFDRIINVPLPTLKERADILEINLKKIKTTPLDRATILNLAEQIPYFSGAQIAQLVNQAALIAARKKLPEVTIVEIQEAIQLIIA